jgi:hypothetical protein
MMMKYLLIVVAFCMGLSANAQWGVSNIPSALLENAHAVVQISETTLSIKNAGMGIRKKHIVVTILDEQGMDEGTLVVAYDKLTKVNRLEGILYSASGEKLRKLKKEEIQDLGNISETNLFDDLRYKLAQFKYADFPFTVEYSYEVTDKNLAIYEHWFPHANAAELAIQKNTLAIEVPYNLPLRYKELNGIAAAQISKQAETTIYTWSVSNLKVHEGEDFTPNWVKKGPGVMASPSVFEMEGYRGDYTTWQNVGVFDNLLNQNRDQLSPSIVAEIQVFTAAEATKEGKVRKVYEYLQQKTRYISIQLGIGGLQPFAAQYVAAKGYGDCKALSNYTKALLKTIGIESYYASIRAGHHEPDILVDFPSQQFNHVILCVPMSSDTIWLECTSQTNPFGYLSNFTSNRHTLLATPKGGVLVKTPALTASSNTANRKATIKLDATGTARATLDISFSGALQDIFAEIMELNNTEKQIEYLPKYLALPSASLEKLNWQREKSKVPKVQLTCEANLKRIATASGSRLFVTPDIFLSEDFIPKNTGVARTNPIELFDTFTHHDEVTIMLPTHQAVEVLPPTQTFQSKFGTFTVKYTLQDSKLIYTRHFVRNNGIFEAKDYQELTDFYKKIAKADKSQLVLKL